MNVLMNTSWWVGALRQRREIDLREHVGERAHQSVDPHATHRPSEDGTLVEGPLHGAADYELTDWEKAWITARIDDAHELHLKHRTESLVVLGETHEEHEARELLARARSYFGGSHEATRAALAKARDAHERGHANAHMITYRDENGARANLAGEVLDLVRAQHMQAIKQIDDYLMPVTGLIDRHIATVKADVAQKRADAQKKVADHDRLISIPHADHVAREHARVRDELRKA